MTIMQNHQLVEAPARLIYELAKDTERWPVRLPHYRFVRVLASDGNERRIEMGARRGFVPVRWTAIQRNDDRAPAIYFTHVAGPTRGMDVCWSFTEQAGLTTVTIEHRLTFAFPIAAAAIERHIVAGYFIDGIATRTLQNFKRIAEEMVRE